MIAALLWLMLQEPPKPEPPKPEPPKVEEKKPEEKKESILAIVGADVYTVTKGVLRDATIVVKDSKIDRIGQKIEIPEGATKIDAAGLRAYPGWIAATSNGFGNHNAGGKFVDATDPFTLELRLAVACGVTSCFVDDGSGRWGGGMSRANAALRLTPGEIDAMVWAEPVAVDFTSWTRMTPAQKQETLDKFKQAKDWLDKQRDFEKRKGENKLTPNEQEPARPGGMEDFIGLLRGDLRARIAAGAWTQIEEALELADAVPIKIVLVGAEEGWIHPEEIARRHVMCIIDPRSVPRKDKQSGRPSGGSIELAAKLKQGGVKFAVVPPTTGISTDGIAGRDLMTLPWDAAFAIRGGLDEQTALEAITITAAEIVGIADRVGSIEEGKEADLILLDGDPFHYKTMVQKTIVAGRVVYDKATSPFFAHIRPKAQAPAPAPKPPEPPKSPEPAKPTDEKKP